MDTHTIDEQRATSPTANPQRFFVPTAQDDAHAEELWRVARTYASAGTRCALRDTRIRALAWTRGGRPFWATVGRRFRPTGGTAIAIFESEDRYLVCTHGRGFLRGLPIVVGKREVSDRELFDAMPGA